MSERETPNQVKNAGEDASDEMRPLPDGGLGASMPDWLRKPPAWRNLSRPEDAPEPAAKDLPEPDTSVIDPRTLVDLDDLPSWLQDLAARSSDEPPASGTEARTVAESKAAPPLEPTEAPSGPAPSTTVELTTNDATPAPARSTPTWIWVMRGAIILSLLLVIYYVFFL